MGLLFTTPDTRYILQKLNGEYQPIKQRQVTYDVPILRNASSLFDAAQQIGLVPNSTPTSRPYMRWQDFLNAIDPLPYNGSTIGQLIRGAIIDALQAYPTCTDIEFFACPSTEIAVSVSNIPTFDQNGRPDGTYTKCICLETRPADEV